MERVECVHLGSEIQSCLICGISRKCLLSFSNFLERETFDMIYVLVRLKSLVRLWSAAKLPNLSSFNGDLANVTLIDQHNDIFPNLAVLGATIDCCAFDKNGMAGFSG